MSNLWKKADETIFVGSALGSGTLLIIIIVFIGIVKGCFHNKAAPIDDDSINKSTEIISNVMVVDSTRNGFRVVYATAKQVSNERFSEIYSRPSVWRGFDSLKIDAVSHFNGDLLNADICEFALYAYRFHIDNDIRVHNIFTAGSRKMNFYVQPNPNLKDCATWMHFGTEQGNQYLNFEDINIRIPNGQRIYRYWKCSYLYQTSENDERFSHFINAERLF